MKMVMDSKKMAVIFMVCIVLTGTLAPFSKIAVEYFPPMFTMFLRFFTAFLILIVFMFKHVKANFKKESIKCALITSAFLTAACSLYTFSAAHTTATNLAFYLATAVLMVPFLAKIINKVPYTKYTLIGIAVTVVGLLGLVFNSGSLTFNFGDFLALCSAITFSFQIVFVGKYIKKVDFIVLSTLQFGIISAMSLVISLVTEDVPTLTTTSSEAWIAVLVLGIFGTIAQYGGQNAAQRYLKESTIGIMLAMLPLYTAVFAWVLLGEVLSIIGITGGILMVVGAMVASIPDKKEPKLSTTAE